MTIGNTTMTLIACTGSKDSQQVDSLESDTATTHDDESDSHHQIWVNTNITVEGGTLVVYDQHNDIVETRDLEQEDIFKHMGSHGPIQSVFLNGDWNHATDPVSTTGTINPNWSPQVFTTDGDSTYYEIEPETDTAVSFDNLDLYIFAGLAEPVTDFSTTNNSYEQEQFFFEAGAETYCDINVTFGDGEVWFNEDTGEYEIRNANSNITFDIVCESSTD